MKINLPAIDLSFPVIKHTCFVLLAFLLLSWSYFIQLKNPYLSIQKKNVIEATFYF